MKDEDGTRGEDRESVLEVVERITGEAPSVSLSDVESSAGSSPIALDPSTEVRFSARTRGDYQVLGEVARGGMGTILRGHDRDLRRDVAIKVLDEELSKRPDIVQRFVEEAQIGGQLQHPGVVPVYELGLMADERPFFTMKLIKGRTLASMLGARPSPASELRRFLSIFEQVCQTMAYAHSKGVIHRDLKPSNIMVGPFGEVQVVDWGLAKVLQRGGVADERRAARDRRTTIETVRSGSSSIDDQSIAGSVMGTPAYMPPEQARGEVEGLDERADVFALGALLCEVLTGDPPYVEEPGSEPVVVQAGRAHLEPARARLASRGSDEELRRLCLDCLAPAPQARPASAEEVSRAIHAHLSDTEERARRAQLEAAEARVKAAEERKRRRLAVALAATVVVLLVAVGSGYAWIERQRQQRLDDAIGRFDALQASAVELSTEGRHEEALGPAREAARLATSEELGEERIARVTGFVARTESLAEDARTRAELERRNAALFDRLDQIQVERATSPDMTAEAADRAYAEAFREYGLDLEADDVEETLAELRRRGMGEELASAIDFWVLMRLQVQGGNTFEVQTLTAFAIDLDPDEVRTLVRTAMVERDADELRHMAAELEVERLEPVTIGVLVNAVRDVGGEVEDLLRRAVQAHPRDARVRMMLADMLWSTGPASLALQEAEVAHVLEPDSVYVLRRLATFHAVVGAYPRAIRLYEELLERHPEEASDVLQELGFCHSVLGNFEVAREYYDRAWEAADINAMRATERQLARFLDGTYTLDELEEALRDVPNVAYVRAVMAWGVLMTRDPSRRDPERALALIDEALRLAEPDWVVWLCIALANHWLERPAETLAALSHLDPLLASRVDIAVMGAALRAVAYQRLGDGDAARSWLSHAQHRMSVAAGPDPEAWQRSRCVWLLTEAEGLVD